MKAKLIFLISLCLLLASKVEANGTTKEIKTTLQEVTVFFNGAELTHKASTTVSKGVNEISITGLSPNINVNSLKISTTKGVIVASHEYSLDYINPKIASTVEKTLKDSIKYYQKQILDIQVSLNTNKEVLELLKQNRAIGGSQTGLSVTELTKMVDYYTTKSKELNKANAELETADEKAEEALERLESQLAQESVKNTKTVGVLKLNLTAPMATTTDLVVTYFTKNATWAPRYDINVLSAKEQIDIESRAQVAQTTGLDWEKVKLSLSTATPSVSKEAPLFDAWFVDFRQNMVSDALRGRVAGMSVAQNSHSYGDNFKREQKNITIRGASTIEKETAQPAYVVNGEFMSAREFATLDPSMIDKMEVLKDASATAIYGSRASDGVIVVTTKGLENFVSREEGDLNAVYNIDLPYTILGNGKIQNIDLQKHSTTATFKHYAIPKLDTEVFALAEIADWQKLGLLSGKANVTFDGTYVGETIINAASLESKLTLTLGVDKRVSVKREKLQDFSSKKTFGRNVSQEFVYKITVKNNQSKAINLVVKDQYPISNQKEIEVELHKDLTPTTHVNEEVGVWVWEFELGAGQSKELKVGYTLKYPKDKAINLR